MNPHGGKTDKILLPGLISGQEITTQLRGRVSAVVPEESSVGGLLPTRTDPGEQGGMGASASLRLAERWQAGRFSLRE